MRKILISLPGKQGNHSFSQKERITERLKSFTTPLLALTALVLLIFFISKDPAESLYYFFTSPFSSMLNFGNMLNYASLLAISAFGISLVFKTGMFNLGGEGQIYAGIFTAAVIGAYLKIPSGIVVVIIAILSGAVIGALMGSVSGYLKMKWNTNDLITSFLLSAAVIHIINYMITGPFSDPSSYLITTKEIPENLRFAKLLPPSKFNIFSFMPLIFAIVYHIYLYRTANGLKLKTIGENRLFATYSGVRTGYYLLSSFCVSGFLNGFTGGLAAFGTYYMCAYNSTAGIGWSAIAVSLIGKNKPLLILPSALFIAYIETGLSGITLFTGFPLELGSILQAIVFFTITANFFIKGDYSDRRSF